MSGKLTCSRHRGDTLLTDHHSRLIYVVIFQGTNNDETIDSKREYDRLLGNFGHKVRGHGADNSRFNSKEFQEDCELVNQKLTFCGVCAHHQNGIGKSTNRRIVEDARVSLLHAKRA